MKLLLTLAAVIAVTGCAATPEKTQQPPDVSGVDVPMLLLQRQAYVAPKDATNDAFFAAHSENKGIAKLQDFQMGLIERLMLLSHESGHKITLHGGATDVH